MIFLEELCTLLKVILVVALNEYVDVNENGEELPSESRLQHLNIIIKGTDTSKLTSKTDENLYGNNTDNSEKADDKDASWFQWSASIYKNAKPGLPQKINFEIS